MGLLDRVKGSLEGKLAGLNGNLDFLQGCCAAGVLMAASDNNISEAEEKAATTSVKSNAGLKKAFTERQIETTMVEMIQKGPNTFSGKNSLFKELDDVVQKDKDGKLGMAEAVLLVALDVGHAGDGELQPEERVMAEKIAKRLGCDLNKYLN